MQRLKMINLNQKGLTLVEIIIYFTLLSIILVIITDLLIKVTESSLESTSKSAVETEGEIIIKRISYDIHRAESIAIPVNPGNVSPNLELVINGTNIKYSLIGSSITIDDGTADPITSNLVKATLLSFEKVGSVASPTIKISFTLQATKNTKQGAQVKNFETVVALR